MPTKPTTPTQPGPRHPVTLEPEVLSVIRDQYTGTRSGGPTTREILQAMLSTAADLYLVEEEQFMLRFRMALEFARGKYKAQPKPRGSGKKRGRPKAKSIA